MKWTGVTFKLLAITVTLVAVSLAVVGTVAWQMRQTLVSARDRQALSDERVKATLELITRTDQVQAAYQRISRERDPDRLEALLSGVEKEIQGAKDFVARSQGGSPEVGRQLSVLIEAGEKVKSAVLRAEYAVAQQLMLEECNPAFEALLHAVTAGESARQTRASAAAMQEAAREQSRCWVLSGAGAVVLVGLMVVSLFALKRIQDRLSRAVREMDAASSQMKSASSQVSAASQQLAIGASRQAESLQQTTALSGEMQSVTQRNADSAGSVSELMSATSAVVGEANQRLSHLVASMREINQSSGKISKIIKAIDDIAFQTNILALNAAVEAARAGEMGQGFAVVADEVRSLAQRCAQAAEDTTSLIQESASRSKEGGQRLDEVARVISTITQQAEDARELAGQVNAASQQQAGGIRQIATSLSQMQAVTHQTAASAEESAAAAEQMQAQSEAMRSTVENLRDLVGAVD